MTQPGSPGSTDDDGFGPTRIERGAQAVAPKAPPAGAPLVRGRSAPASTPAPSAPPKGTGPTTTITVPQNGARSVNDRPVNEKQLSDLPAAGPAIADAPTTAVPNVAPKPGANAAKAPGKATARGRGPRRARLQLRNVNAWTVFKFSSVLAVFLFLAWLIIVMLLFGVLNASGVIGDINRSVTTINGPGSSGVVNGGRVFAYALIIGAVNAVLFIALTTVGSVVYNLCADLVGGVEVTLSERDS